MKKLITATALCMAMIIASAFTFPKNGKVIMIVSIEVKNVAEWKKMFDSGADVRKKAGIKVISICSGMENENQLVVIEEAENAKAANDFIAVLKSKQKDGNMAKLDVKMYDKID